MKTINAKTKTSKAVKKSKMCMLEEIYGKDFGEKDLKKLCKQLRKDGLPSLAKLLTMVHFPPKRGKK